MNRVEIIPMIALLIAGLTEKYYNNNNTIKQ